MGAFDQTFANNLLNGAFRFAAFPTLTSGAKVKLMSANGSATAAGTEISGGSYSAGGIAATFGTNASGGSIATTAAITQTNMPATTTVGVEITDSTGTPVRLAWGALAANKTTASGDTLTIASGSLSIAFP